MTQTDEIIERERRFLLPTYSRYPIALQRGKGVFLYDCEGKRFFGLTCFHLPGAVWLYEKVTKHYTNLIPTGKSFSVLLNDRHGYTSEFQMSKKNAETLIGRILGQYPWIVGGYSDERKNLWNSQRAAFVAVVDERRLGTASTARAGS